MKLKDWMEERGLVSREVADLIDVDEVTVRRYMHGDRFPRPNILKRITDATGGMVTANDFVGGVSDSDPLPDPPLEAQGVMA